MGLFGLGHIFSKITKKFSQVKQDTCTLSNGPNVFTPLAKCNKLRTLQKSSFYHKVLQNFPQIHTATIHIFKLYVFKIY